jgi:hypothetical protein
MIGLNDKTFSTTFVGGHLDSHEYTAFSASHEVCCASTKSIPLNAGRVAALKRKHACRILSPSSSP